MLTSPLMKAQTTPKPNSDFHHILSKSQLRHIRGAFQKKLHGDDKDNALRRLDLLEKTLKKAADNKHSVWIG